MASSSPQKTPRGGGRLSLYFDIEEDLGILDFDKDQFAFISSDHFWLLNDDDEIRNEVGSMESTLQWMDDFSVIQDDSYFTISNGYPKDTPTNGFGRFDYLTKSVSRNATITKRKVELNLDNGHHLASLAPVSQSKFGTFTKRAIQHDTSFQNGDSSNRTFEVLKEGNLTESGSDLSESSRPVNGVKCFVNSSATTPSINTNTITKNRRSFVRSRLRDSVSSESDFINNHCSETNSTFEVEDEQYSSNEIANNNDLRRQNHTHNGTYVKDSDTDDSSSLSSGNRNYPTISRNNTRTLLREPSQGQINYSNQRQKQQQFLTTTSNDDLLSDSSAISIRSNLSMTSSISGRSEPNLLGSNQSHSLTNAQNSKLFQNRPSKLAPNNRLANMSSKLVHPSSQNGTLHKKVIASKLPNVANSYGSMSSLPQSNIGRATSQTLLGPEVDEDYTGSENMLLNGNSPSHKLLSGLSRNTTFRVHRPTPITNVLNVFADQPVAPSNHSSSRMPIKCNSDDNLMHSDITKCSQEDLNEMNEFRTKVFNSNGHLRPVANNQQSMQSRQFHSNSLTNGNPNNNRPDSPLSNSSTCSSNSSISKIPSCGSLSYRANGGSHYGSNGNIRIPKDSSSIPASSVTSHSNNNYYNNSSHKALSLNNNNNFNNNNNNSESYNNNNNNCNQNGLLTNNSLAKGVNTSRIPALPKCITTAPNRSGIPVSGIPQRANCNEPTTLARKTTKQPQFHQTGTNRFVPSNHPSSLQQPQMVAANPANNSNSFDNYTNNCNQVNRHIDDNSWQNDCF